MGIEDADDFLEGHSSEVLDATVIPLPLQGSSGSDSLVKDLLLKT